MPVLTRGPSLLQIGGDGCAHIGGHRQELLTPTLAAHAQVAAVPVAVLELQRDDLVSAKPQTSQLAMFIVRAQVSGFGVQKSAVGHQKSDVGEQKSEV